MKINKFTLAAISASLVAGSANAAQDYYLYGSTAYRHATADAVLQLFNEPGNTLTSAVGDAGTGVYVALGANSGDNAWVVSGVLANQGLGAVTVHGTWSGSVGGQARLLHNDALANTFLAPGAVGNPLTYMPAHSPDFAMCDNLPSSTPFEAPTPGYATPTTIQVAVVDFVIAANQMNPPAVLPAGLQNVSGYQLQSLFSIGCIPLGQLDGNAADNSIGIYAVGRDDDSGTRAIFEADTGLGVGTPVTQYLITGAPYKYTAAGTAGINFPFSGAGYSSGGNVETALAVPNPGNYVAGQLNLNYTVPAETASYAVAYIAVSDWKNNVNQPALNYNGVPFNVNNVLNGTYSYWGYENANVRMNDYNSNLNGIATFANALTTIQASDAGNALYPGTIALGAMACSRAGDGQVILHN
jgi:ABC-type phosphate transport system substrate-binding protein